MWQIVTRKDIPRKWAALMGLLALLFVVAVSSSDACTTPVYRYAMYNWAPSPYYVFYFHRGDPPAEDAKVNETMAKLPEPDPKAANLAFEAVDLAAEDEFDRLPGPVKEAWKEHVGEDAEKAEPVHLVFSAWGAKLHAGRLDEPTLKALVDSPMRTKICQLIEDDHMAVMLFLPGSDKAKNEVAKKVAKEVIAMASAGEIYVESAAMDPDPSQWMPPGEATDDESAEQTQNVEDEPPPPPGLKIAFVELTRDDKKEQWLVRSLTAMEPDLVELAEEPMIFFAYGRGRAMPPYVGKGITADNLAGEIQFLGSACSCFVKEQNPGADLLVNWDWESTADAIAATDPSMSGDPYAAYQEFSPSEPMEEVDDASPDGPADEPADSPEPEALADAGNVTPDAQPESETGSSPPDVTVEASDAPPVAEPEAVAAEELESNAATTVVEEPPEDLGGITPLASPEPGGGGSFASKQIWIIGLALGAGIVLVLIAGSLLTRRRAMAG